MSKKDGIMAKKMKTRRRKDIGGILYGLLLVIFVSSVYIYSNVGLLSLSDYEEYGEYKIESWIHRLAHGESDDELHSKESARMEDATHPSVASDVGKGGFQIKHIFHHGVNDNYMIHRRLDVKEEHRRAMRYYKYTQKEIQDPSDLEQVYRQYDWPKAHGGKNPWDIRLDIKAAPEKRPAMMLKERHTPNFIESYLDYSLKVKGDPKKLSMISLEWEQDEIKVPDVNDLDTVVSLASISSNAYVHIPIDDEDKKKSDWIDVGGGWAPIEDDDSIGFGWAEKGVRGHVFVSEDNKTVVIGIKGTSGAGLPGSGSDETTDGDKTNDNLLFSCCCARISYLWKTVCDCYEKTYTCNQDCLEKELMRNDRYYMAALDIYKNVTAMYPPETTNIWVTGHSLGGALSSLLGRTFGLPAVAFEAPGELLATKRLHLPQPPGIPKYMENIWHFGNTADPIYMGVCNGASSSCNAAGYAMETACHTGKQCVYDVVTDKGWKVNMLNHRIHTVIDEVLLAYNETATCVDQPPCRDCFNWRFTSHDDDEGNEPLIPNPLKPKPHPSHSKSQTRTSSDLMWSCGPSSDLASPTSSSLPQKCLKRTWYGWCAKWGYDDDKDSDDEADGDSTTYIM